MEGKKSTKGKKPQTTSDSIDLYSLQEKYTSHSISYKYSTFDELVEQGEYNFFGIIYDASFPQEEQDLSKYTCILKLIDQTTNCLTHPKDFNDNIIYLIIKSNERENIPFAHHIGDIIRVHRGFYSPKKKRNVYLNLNKDNKDNQLKGWCLYHWNINNNEPYACSNKKYSFESQDKPNLEGFKNWIRTYIGIDKSLVYPMQIKLENRNSEGDDKDLMVHVVKKIEADNHLILFIQDETDGCELHTYKYYNFIQENDIIRIRSFKIFDNSNLIINEFGNILIVPDNSSCAKTVFNELAKKMKSIK
jgi:hypothetical protein